MSAPKASAAPSAPDSSTRTVAVIDMGASAIRLVVAEIPANGSIRILEEASRGVLLGKDTFAHGKLNAPTVEATLKALVGFRHIMDTYGVEHYRAVATSAVREAANSETFLDRVRLRARIDVETIDGSEENRLTYMAVREALKEHEALRTGHALLVEVGGGSADISFLRKGEPIHSGAYALGSIRMRQSLGSWHGSHEQRMRLLRRHIHNVVEDIRQEIPMNEADRFIALGGDVRFAAAQITGGEPGGVHVVGKEAFLALCERIVALDVDQLVEEFHLPQAEAETLVPALLAYRELLTETAASEVTIPDVSLRAGMLLDLVQSDKGLGIEHFRKQVLASALALGEKYRFDAPHAKNVAHLATRLFDELREEHGLEDRDRLLLEVAALLHDVGIYVSLRGHHKHSQYILSVAEIFGLSRDDMLVVSNVARYHRRGTPQKSHLPYTSLDRGARLLVNKLGSILRVANALDADHLQKVKDLKVRPEDESWILEVQGAGDMTIERLVALSRSDLFAEVFGRRIAFREAARP